MYFVVNTFPVSVSTISISPDLESTTETCFPFSSVSITLILSNLSLPSNFEIIEDSVFETDAIPPT